VWVTTYDRERRLGALYRFLDGKPVLFAGGRPTAGSPPLLRHPEGVAIDSAGDIYVADREEGAIVRLDARGNLVTARHAALLRPRILTIDEAGNLWVGGDGTAETPFGSGNGEISRVAPDGRAQSVLQGPLPAGFSMSPGGALFVVQRRTGQIFALTPEGRRLDFAAARNGSFLRGLAFAPVTPETRRAGIAGDLFLVLVSRSLWMINEVVRISGPFDDWVRQEAGRPAP
jgi:sugar lactone lactonase YvrE